MTAPLSNDLCQRVVAAIAAGESCRSASARFGVAVSSAVKWSQRYRATGSVAPAKIGGYRKRVLEPHRAFIVERIDQVPHLTLHRLKDELAARGVTVSHNEVWQFLRREGLRFKKTLFALEQARADIARRRQRWRSFQANLDPHKLVFIDESEPLKAPLVRAQCRTIEDTWRHIGHLISTIEPGECENYLANAGYASVKK